MRLLSCVSLDTRSGQTPVPAHNSCIRMPALHDSSPAPATVPPLLPKALVILAACHALPRDLICCRQSCLAISCHLTFALPYHSSLPLCHPTFALHLILAHCLLFATQAPPRGRCQQPRCRQRARVSACHLVSCLLCFVSCVLASCVLCLKAKALVAVLLQCCHMMRVSSTTTHPTSRDHHTSNIT